jgi:hypothetical protein
MPQQSSAKMQSYCDSSDPYCCDGSDEATHQGYGNVYGQDALTFIKGKLDSSSSASAGAATEGSTTNGTVQTGAGNSASVPATGATEDTGAQQGATTVPVTGGAQDAGAQTGAANQGAGQWGQAQGQGQWGGWGRKN